MNRICQTSLYAVFCIIWCLPNAARSAEPFDLDAVLQIFEAVVNDVAPAPRPARAVLQLNQNEAQIKQMTPHFVQQLRPALMSELAFIRQMCDLPKEQRPKIKAAGEASLEKAARGLAEQQFGNNRRMSGGRNEPADARKIIADELNQALQLTLTTEQMAQYTSEAIKRADRRKRAAILSAVSLLDETLSLTAEQREKIYDSIAANWQPGWEQWLMLQRYGGQYFPMIPDQQVVPHLNDEQRSVWSGLQRISFGGWSGAEGQVPEDDGWWGDEPAKPADAAGAVGGFGAPLIIEAR
ncbi:MAG: hypothetical protein WD894_08345 [Pirellulales bacterium]